MKIKLHDYQIECIEAIKNHFVNNDRQIVQLPTGSGKTFIFLNFLKMYAKSALILCPSLELQEQIHEWGSFFLGKENIEKGWKHNSTPFHIMTLASLNYESNFHKVNKGKFDFIIMDEAHHGCANTFKNFIEKLSVPRKILGLTATPERLDNKSLLSIFHTLTYEKNIQNMIEFGHLCDIEAYKIKTMCELRFKGTGEDFSQIDLKTLDSNKRNSIILETIQKECFEKKTLIFCLNIEHAMKISNSLNDIGFSSEYIHGRMNYKERQEILERFKSGKTRYLTNCQLLTEGFDEPSIEALVLTRPTRSKSLYCQMIGRGLRKYPKKDKCLLFELADNNHKICTFNILGNLDNSWTFDYPRGLRLSNLNNFIKTVDYEDVIVKKCKHEIFEINQKIEDNFKFPCLDFQKHKLSRLGIPEFLIKETSFLEAQFIIFIQGLKKKYGFIC